MPLDRRTGSVGAERDLPIASQERLGAQTVEDDVGVGVRGLLAAEPVAGWPGIGPRALGAAVRRASRVDPGDGPAPCADRHDVNRRERDRNVELRVPLGAQERCAVDDDRDVGARSPQVEGDDVVPAEAARDGKATHDAGGRPRLAHARRRAACRLCAHQPPARVRDQHATLELVAGEDLVEPGEVGRQQWPEVGVDDGRARALELPDLGNDRAARAAVDAGQLLAHDRERTPLVVGVDERVDEADRHRLHASCAEGAGGLPDLVLGQGVTTSPR